MPKRTEKTKVLHPLEACSQPLTTTNKPVANVIDGNVQLYVLSYIPDNFQGVAEMVLDHLPKSSRGDFIRRKQNSILVCSWNHEYFGSLAKLT